MKAPNGNPIVATDERCPGTSGILWDEDGTWDYDGNGTEMGWDAQDTVKLGGQIVFLDEDSNQWLECQLIPDDAEPLPADQIKPWHADKKLRQIEIRNTLKDLARRLNADPTGVEFDLDIGEAINSF